MSVIGTSLKMNIPTSLVVLSVYTVQWALAHTVIDLTHPLSAATVYWPGVPNFNRSRVLAGANNKNVWMEIGVFSSGEHGGTHIDAPRHFNPNGYDLNDLPIELTIAEGVTIDARPEAANNSDYFLTVQKIEEWETIHGDIPSQAAVLVNTGWASRWPSPRRIFNTQTPGDPVTFHFPCVSKEAAQWLVANRQIKMLGVDVPSPDSPRDETFPVHTMLLSRNVLILENVLIPDTLPARHFRLHASPIRIEGGTGTPARIYAMLHDGLEASSGHSLTVTTWSLCFTLIAYFCSCLSP